MPKIKILSTWAQDSINSMMSTYSFICFPLRVNRSDRNIWNHDELNMTDTSCFLANEIQVNSHWTQPQSMSLWNPQHGNEGRLKVIWRVYISSQFSGNEVLVPVPLMVFRSNSKFDKNLECYSLKYGQPITKKFCTRHDSVTVVTCAKFLCDQ